MGHLTLFNAKKKKLTLYIIQLTKKMCNFAPSS